MRKLINKMGLLFGKPKNLGVNLWDSITECVVRSFLEGPIRDVHRFGGNYQVILSSGIELSLITDILGDENSYNGLVTDKTGKKIFGWKRKPLKLELRKSLLEMSSERDLKRALIREGKLFRDATEFLRKRKEK